MQPATARSVEGDFAQSKVVLRGSTYLLSRSGGNFFITESDLTGKPWEHRVEYTLGGRRVQEYLATLPGGRIVVMPAAWDNVHKKWTHDLDTSNPEEDAGSSVQLWNKSCYSCHVSGERKNFDPADLSYRTTWRSLGVDCETCHGPGREHIAKVVGGGKGAILNPAKLDPARSTAVCAQCHSYRDIYVDDFVAGANYYDSFLPFMEYRLPSGDNAAYWADGRPRWMSNEAIGLWQSQCYLKGGATCVTCHTRAHDDAGGAKSNADALCSTCHKAIAANVAAHSHHARSSGGSSCVACHMPAVVSGLDAQMRDHSMSIPVPENTARHGIPNACNLCHQDEDVQWAAARMTAWYGNKSRQGLIRRADAFSAAKQGDATAVSALLAILADRSEGAWIRANAAGYLGGFPDDPTAYTAVLNAFSDPEPLVRATAASAIRARAAQREALAPHLVALLGDPMRTVRMSAATSLVAMGVPQLPGEDGKRFESAKELYRARAALNSDDAAQQLAAGKFFYLAGDFKSAAAAFRTTLELDSKAPAQYFLALSMARAGDLQSARAILNTIPRDDPQYASAARLLATLDAEAPQNDSAARARFVSGETLYQGENYGGALKELDEALRLAPDADWAAKARVYRAICLEKLARTGDAEKAMKELLAAPGAAQDVDLQLAYVELLYDTGKTEEALKRIDALIAAVPKAATAYFWRAKALLELHRAAEAASAAEESVRLQPDAPQAHNLLIRIYQIEGRAREAAQEVQWLRDYERRKNSR